MSKINRLVLDSEDLEISKDSAIEKNIPNNFWPILKVLRKF